MLVGMGMLTEAQARFDVRRNALMRAVVYASPPVDFAFDYHLMPVMPGDVITLATDGAYQAFSDDEWVKTWWGQSLDVAADIVKRRSAALNDDNYSFCATKL
jgi:serine/threonine protein phosphatase PrpC